MNLKNKVKEYRMRFNMNQQELGKEVGVSRQTISSIECGDYHPSVVVALKIAKVFGVSIEEFFEMEDEEHE